MRFVSVLLAVAVLACRGREQAATPVTTRILLRYHPPAGSTYRYVLEQTSSFAPDSGAADDSSTRSTMTLAFSQAIGAPGPEGFPVIVTLDSSQVRSPMLNPEAAQAAGRQLQGLRVTAVLDDRLRFVHNDLSALEGLPAMVREQVQLGLRAAALVFPEEPVGTSDSWTNQTELPFAELTAGTAFRIATKITVREISVSRGDTTVHLAVETELPDRPLRFSFGGQPVTVILKGGITGDQVFSLTRGAVVSGNLGGTVHLHVAGGFLGQEGMAMRMEQRGTMHLVEAR
jgi:hypothetical protein